MVRKRKMMKTRRKQKKGEHYALPLNNPSKPDGIEALRRRLVSDKDRNIDLR